MELVIKKEFDGTTENVSRYNVMVTGGGYTVSGYARKIDGKEDYHFDEEFENMLDIARFNIDDVNYAVKYDCSKITIEHSGFMFGEFHKHRTIEALLEKLGPIDVRYRWDNERVYFYIAGHDVHFTNFEAALNYLSGMAIMRGILTAKK